jgi:hypothetical protein
VYGISKYSTEQQFKMNVSKRVSTFKMDTN